MDGAGSVDASEVAEAIRPLYGSLRRFAAVVGSIEIEPDELVQEALVKLLAAAQWRSIDDLGAHLRRTIVDVVANERRHSTRVRVAVSTASNHVVLVATYPSGLAELGRVDPTSRALLCLVELEGAPISEAASTAGCSEVTARARLSRARRRLHAAPQHKESTADVHDRLDDLASRGQRRGVEAVVATAVAETRPRVDRPAAKRRAKRVRWRAAAAIGTVAVLVVVVVVTIDRHGERHAALPPPPGSAAGVTFPSGAQGWSFVDGEIRDLVDGKVVARFPDLVAPDVPPVRVSNGFVAATAHSEVFDLWLSTSPDLASAVELATLVSGVAASGDGTTIAFAKVSQTPTGPSTLVVEDVATRTVRYSTTFPGYARVVGYSDQRVVFETGIDGAPATALWTPATGQVTTLPDYGGVGGVGPGYAVLHEGAGSCAVLVAITDATVDPVARPDLDPSCSVDRWAVDDRANTVGFGNPSSPKQLRVSLADGTSAVSSTHVVDAIWVDRDTVAALADDGSLVRCDTNGRCEFVRTLAPRTTSFGSQWLIAPLPTTS